MNLQSITAYKGNFGTRHSAKSNSFKIFNLNFVGLKL